MLAKPEPLELESHQQTLLLRHQQQQQELQRSPDLLQLWIPAVPAVSTERCMVLTSAQPSTSPVRAGFDSNAAESASSLPSATLPESPLQQAQQIQKPPFKTRHSSSHSLLPVPALELPASTVYLPSSPTQTSTNSSPFSSTRTFSLSSFSLSPLSSHANNQATPKSPISTSYSVTATSPLKSTFASSTPPSSSSKTPSSVSPKSKSKSLSLATSPILEKLDQEPEEAPTLAVFYSLYRMLLSPRQEDHRD